MKKNLIIVESPAKAKTIGNFLGKNYEVIASKGHIRDLPKTSFGIKIENDEFIPEYRITSDHSSLVKELKEKAKNAAQIYLATDEDREGEAIAYHIAKAIGKDENILPRIVFHEITKSAIEDALKNPRKLNMHSVNAQQTRRLLDRIVGYKLSPLLGQKIQRGLSAGRVQSAALKIIVDREKEIRAFVPLEYFSIDMIFNSDLDAELVEFDKIKIEKLTITNKDRAKLILEACKNDIYTIENIESKERKIAPPPPFMTSTLQQSASNRLGFNPKKTMILAQKLYEGVNTHQGMMGVITYMRTDSLNLAKEAVDKVRKLIQKDFGKDYLPSKANIYVTKAKGAQEAHEAIRPTNLDFTPQIAANFLDKDELKLYTLIYNRFLACQMNPAISQTQNVFVKNDRALFKISGRKILFDGYYKVYGDMDKDKILPNLQKGEKLKIQKLEMNSHFTEPPSRYSEAGLVKKLESLGIGRPSTYAPTISILTSRDYVKIDKKQLIPSDIAFNVTEVLEKNFSDIVDSKFTSNLENTLDDIAEDKADWQNILKGFYYPFMKKIEEGKTKIASQKTVTKLGESCPDCGGELAIRKGRFGEFVACLNFPKCKYSRNLKNENKTNDENITTKKINSIGIICPSCQKGEIVERFSKRGKFYGCSAYPKCNFISKYKPSDEKCEECGENLVIKELKKGTFLECLKCKIKKEIKE
ncbi:type I DNA topoisomerase [Campylobacter sp. LH-2024]|uniref:Type I DNA topoisomerase n=1 Tax=Campylobacter molothri TaxID=1032242 RepID=A0ACC5W3C7_9BACT|nr:type I DNA topoisomerase [Campylobacter sp. RM10537]MBZ7928937.1 type I DNA topoisomerase [Campylobacter sp. RM10542]MBZ7938043.1 type I DNA topoisomerase [Campylobacter sp. RM10538]MBZ7950056.1 type I DNA topoisomerase [Campylobacter sp. RM10534]MBZ7951570.1 type I DNA topoisomerase [Campylobacter sp. W0046]MBZ7958916.1 type I DNA topoisomerase [Campylobacter sp. RM9760]MBZ7961667.1 type I DNA topoisomerase [Campylobacter sp. RM9930]MBZ7975112.1 type I DNA topoisomerase [Campylobacter sp